VIELRASIILGSGSLSFELIRALVERLPIMICPRWVRAKAQSIAIEDVVAYLEESLALPATSGMFEIGGADCVSYEEGHPPQASEFPTGYPALPLRIPGVHH